MTETFEIEFSNNDFYRITQQPEIGFSCYSILGNINIHSLSYPDSRTDTIWLRGDTPDRDDRDVQIFPNHLRALEKLCKIKQWRFVACL